MLIPRIICHLLFERGPSGRDGNWINWINWIKGINWIKKINVSAGESRPFISTPEHQAFPWPSRMLLLSPCSPYHKRLMSSHATKILTAQSRRSSLISPSGNRLIIGDYRRSVFLNSFLCF
jgi:hypothetical protein